MLDIKAMRADPERFRKGFEQRKAAMFFADLLNLDQSRREKLAAVESLKNKRNTVSKEVGRLKANGEDAGALIEEMKEVNAQIKELDQKIRLVEEINALLLNLQPSVFERSRGRRRAGQPPGTFLGGTEKIFLSAQTPLGTWGTIGDFTV